MMEGLEALAADMKDDKRRLAIGVVPSRINENRVTWESWSLISKLVEELANESGGEYSSWQVLRAIDGGEVSLHMMYLNETGKDMGDMEQQAFMWDSLLRDKEKGFVGYFLTRLDSTNIHLWHAYIMKPYRNTEIFSLAFNKIKAMAATLQAPSITFSSNRGAWGAVCEKLGFQETVTIYRMNLKDK